MQDLLRGTAVNPYIPEVQEAINEMQAHRSDPRDTVQNRRGVSSTLCARHGSLLFPDVVQEIVAAVSGDASPSLLRRSQRRSRRNETWR